jgi:hypothetical protein
MAENVWNFTAFGSGVRGSGIFYYKKCLIAKVHHSAEEIQADMHTAYECKRANRVKAAGDHSN